MLVRWCRISSINSITCRKNKQAKHKIYQKICIWKPMFFSDEDGPGPPKVPWIWKAPAEVLCGCLQDREGTHGLFLLKFLFF